MEKNRQNRNAVIPSIGARLAVAAAVASAFAPHGLGYAAENVWRIDPNLTLRGELHNRNGESVGAEKIFEVQPSIAATYKAADLNLRLSYAPRLLVSDLEGQHSDVIHSFSASAQWKPAAGRVDVGANLSVAEYARNPIAPTLDTAPVPRDRVRTYAAQVTAGLRERLDFGMIGRVQSTYQYSQNNSVVATDLQRQSSERLILSTELSPSVRRPDLGWGGFAQFSHREAARLDAENAYKVHGVVLWNPTLQTGGFARIGYERSEFSAIDTSNSGAYFDVGGEWRLSPRTSLSGEIGKHFYGFSYQLSARTRENRSVWELTARRQVSNLLDPLNIPVTDSTSGLLDRYLQPTITDGAQRAAEVQRITSVFGLSEQNATARNFYVDRLALETLLRVSGIYTLPRATVNGAVQYRKVDPGSTPIDILRTTPLNGTTEYSGELGYSYRLSPTTTLTSRTIASRINVTNAQLSSNRFRSDIGLSQQWSRAISTGVTVFYDRQNASDGRSSYTDRGINSTLRYNFR